VIKKPRRRGGYSPSWAAVSERDNNNNNNYYYYYYYFVELGERIIVSIGVVLTENTKLLKTKIP
jgi:hypothetical protein